MVLKNTVSAISKTAAVLLLAGLYSCSTYNSKTTIEADLYNGQFKQAVEAIDKNKFLNKDRNRLLYLLEKGKIESAAESLLLQWRKDPANWPGSRK